MSDPIRVAWLVKGLGPGGAEHLLAAAAGAHDHDAFSIEAFYLLAHKDHLVADLEAHGVPCTCLHVRDERDVRWLARLRAALRRGRFHVLHAHSPYAAAMGRLVVRSLPRAERPVLVSTEHNPWSTFRIPTRIANAATARFDDAVFAVSAEARDSMSPRVRARAEVLVHGVDVAGIRARRAERAAVRAELAVPDDVVLLGTVANYHPKKDWPNLLRAHRLLVERGVPFRACAVGQGPLEAEVQAQHRALGLAEHVVLTGFRADAVRLMAGCDVFVLGSRWEGLPVALMEASALGLPIVATAVGGIPDHFDEARGAVLVPSGDPAALADAVERLVRDPDARASLGAASGARAADFDGARAVRRIEAVYRSLVAR